MLKTFGFFAAATAALLVLPGGSEFRAAGQEPLPPQQPPIRTGTTLVTVDVYPTRDGVTVEGLTAGDFEVHEDGKPQTIERFEFVRIEAGATEEAIQDPGNERDMLARVADPRRRLFVLFLDRPHVGLDGSRRSRVPLLTMLRRTLSAEDLFAVMTEATDVRMLTFGRGMTAVEQELTRHWEWGDASKPYLDEVETILEACYAGTPAAGVLGELYGRRREDKTLHALEQLVAHLEGLREGRKVVFVFGSGWRLFERSESIPRELAKLGAVGVAPPVAVVPGEGRLRMGSDVLDGSLFGCNAEANRLANLQHGQRFRDLLRAASQANVAFYPVELTGVSAGSRRVDQFRTLASETGGDAVVMTNDLGAGLEKVTRPLMAYYLIGYSPTNTAADGRLRRIEVRVKQPGIDVRARKGYRALSEAEMATMSKGAAPERSAFETEVARAVSRLSQIHESVVMYVHGVAASVDGDAARLWVTGEIDAARRKDWSRGGTVELTVGSAPEQVTASATLAPGARTWTAEVSLPAMPDGNLPIRTRLTAPDRATPLAGAGALHGERPEALLFRRGPITGNRYEPAADRRFSRTERVRLDVPAGPAARAGAGRLMAADGKPLNIPVTVTERIEGPLKWISAEIALAPLGMGDYVVQMDVEEPAGTRQALTAIRVTR
jgi:VWFA-related protein